ncbi:hypothetical protein [Vogesella indigofera]|uniref:hypothetical protein n=1 Tax=Vogesella indigofera TaxID=45465 RepID=UPI00234F1FFD|nr:hypothetical protein [Vogesella indigofera]MDC7697436.1 hypothetical protein [Vogesella indigofera]
MILWLRNIAAYFICAIAATALSRWIESTVTNDVVLPNLTTIVIALMAINVQTTAVIAVKLRELADKHNANFSNSVKQFIFAFYEQGSLVILSLTLSAISKAKIEIFNSQAIECASFFIIFSSLHIFIDTTIGLLICLFPETDD